MKCLNEGSLQSYIDGELTDIEMKEVETHLFQCEKCKKLYKELNSINSFAMEKLQDYKNEFNINHMKPEDINIEIKIKKGEFKNMKRYKKVAAAACAALVLTTCITVKPIRAAVINAVSIFRAKDIKSVNISLEDVKKLQNELEKRNGDINIDKIGKVKYEGGDSTGVTIDEAKKILPFAIPLPKNLSQNDISNAFVIKPSKTDFTLNVENINGLLKSLGGKQTFPKNLDGKTFSFNLAGTLNIDYKDSKTNKKIYITESKMPEILAPADANIDELFNALSDLSVLPTNMQKQLKSMKDWKSTLYIPNVGDKAEELNIDGLKAIGYFGSSGYKQPSILILKDDILISISGNVAKDDLIQIAKSMR